MEAPDNRPDNLRQEFALVSLALNERKLRRMENELSKAYQEYEQEIAALSLELPLLPVIKKFSEVFRTAFPEQNKHNAISQALLDLNTIVYIEPTHLELDISMLLMRICYSEGPQKIFDYEDPTYYDDLVCQQVLDQHLFFQEKFVRQMIRLLQTREPVQFLLLNVYALNKLHPRLLPLMIELGLLFKDKFTKIKS